MRHNKEKVISKGALTLSTGPPQQGRGADIALVTLATPPAGVARGTLARDLGVHVQEALAAKLVTGRGQGAGAHLALEACPGISVVSGGTRGHWPPTLASGLQLIARGAGLTGEAGVAKRTEALLYEGRPAQSSVSGHSSLQLNVLDSDIYWTSGEVLGSDQDHLNIGEAAHQVSPVSHLASRARVRAEAGKPEAVIWPESDRNLVVNIRSQIVNKIQQCLDSSLNTYIVHLYISLGHELCYLQYYCWTLDFTATILLGRVADAEPQMCSITLQEVACMRLGQSKVENPRDLQLRQQRDKQLVAVPGRTEPHSTVGDAGPEHRGAVARERDTDQGVHSPGGRQHGEKQVRALTRVRVTEAVAWYALLRAEGEAVEGGPRTHSSPSVDHEDGVLARLTTPRRPGEAGAHAVDGLAAVGALVLLHGHGAGELPEHAAVLQHGVLLAALIRHVTPVESPDDLTP